MGKQAIGFARRFSRHMKKVEIQIFLPFDSSNESFSDLNTFSELFDVSVLRKIEIQAFSYNTYDYKDEWNEKFLKAFIRLCENQNSLEEFSIRDIYFSLTQGVKILRSLAQTYGKTLKKLDLHRCMTDNFQTDSHTGPVITEIKKFSNLIEVDLNSVFLCDDLLPVWSLKCPKLKLIHIDVSSQNYVLSCEAWRALVKTNPELNVSMAVYVQTISSLQILSPAIPLVSLAWYKGLCFTSELELKSFLQRLASYKKTLDSLRLEFIVNFGDPDHAAVMNVIPKFSKLPPLTFKRSSPDSNILIIKDEKKS